MLPDARRGRNAGLFQRRGPGAGADDEDLLDWLRYWLTENGRG
jgi:hypothetical protein